MPHSDPLQTLQPGETFRYQIQNKCKYYCSLLFDHTVVKRVRPSYRCWCCQLLHPVVGRGSLLYVVLYCVFSYQTDASCLRCNNVKNGPYCVPECPVTKYPDDNGVCQDCHENCQYFGCTGALNSVGHGACNACEIAVYDSNHEVTMCLQPDSDCDTGYFKYLNLPSEYDPMTGNKVSFLNFLYCDSKTPYYF